MRQELNAPFGHRPGKRADYRELKRAAFPVLVIDLAPQIDDRALIEAFPDEAFSLRRRIRTPEGREMDTDIPVDSGANLPADSRVRGWRQYFQIPFPQHDALVRTACRHDRFARRYPR